MRPEEAGAVVDLLMAANEEHLARFPPPIDEAYRQELASVPGRLGAGEVYVAEVGGELAGTVTFFPDAGLDGHPWPPGGAAVRFLAVAPPARGQGVGGALLGACVDEARRRGASFVGLHTAPFMDAAVRLYEHHGFSRAPRHDFDPDLYYGRGRSEGDERVRGLAYMLWFDDGDR